MKHYALLGEKLGHSLSCPIHEAIFRELGIDADYRLIEIPRAAFAETAETLLHQLDGFNVTIPYKKEIMPLLAEIDPLAAEIGAVNTVQCAVRRGFNTDAAGFMGMLRHAGIRPDAAARSYILGSGATSKTVCACLKAMGARHITVVSRHPSGADEITYDAFYARFPQTGGLIVNATSAGMWPRHSEGDICAIHPSRVDEMMRYAQGVADVVYNPPRTFLTEAADRAGVPWCTGLYMLVEQAVRAEAIWQGCDMPAGLTEQVMHHIEKEVQL